MKATLASALPSQQKEKQNRLLWCLAVAGLLVLSNYSITISISKRVISSSKFSYIQLLVLAVQIETLPVFGNDYTHCEVQFTQCSRTKIVKTNISPNRPNANVYR